MTNLAYTAANRPAAQGDALTRYAPVVGRVLIALLFLMGGFGKITAPGPTMGYIASVGLPFPPLALAAAIIVEIGGGLLLLAGYRTRIVASLLAVFTVVTAFAFHADFADQNQMIHFLKNIAITGGFLQLVAFGAGAFSLDAKAGRA